jgi:citrate lyase subunit beta / citryl-CoA lyase
MNQPASSERVRPRRSALFMPASNARALEKAKTLAADVVILDLEDAVAPGAKPNARAMAAAAVRGGGYGRRELVVRVNGLDTPWGLADIGALAAAGADALLLPKVESPAAVERAVAALAAAGAPDGVALWCMIETPRGVLGAEPIAATAAVAALVVGTSDLAKELRVRALADRSPLLASLALCVLAARAHGRVVLDGVHLDLDDEAGFAAVCRQGRDMGFDGKTLIHPKQIAAANQVFSPSGEEVERARRVIAAHVEALAAGRGLAVLDGQLVENLHAEEARRIIALAEAIASRRVSG